MGDLLDRGDQEVELLYWLERIAKQAKQHGGAVHVINGNHGKAGGANMRDGVVYLSHMLLFGIHPHHRGYECARHISVCHIGWVL